MKKVIILTMTTLLLISCDSTNRQYKAIIEILNIEKPLSRENMEKARLMILETTDFTAAQAIDLQGKFTDYMQAYASKEALRIEDKFNTIYNGNDAELISKQVDSLNREIDTLRKYGIIIYSAEGFVESEVMPMYITETFWKYLTEAEKKLSQLAEFEVEDPSIQDAAITVPFQELCNRLKLSDQMATAFPEDELYPQILACQQYYLSLLMVGVDNSPAYNWETHLFEAENKQAILNYIAENPSASSTPILKEFMALLETSKYKSTPEIERFIAIKLDQH